MNSSPGELGLLEHLRSVSKVDCDSLDLQLSQELGPFVDCTSNQADSYLEVLEPHRSEILRNSAELSQVLQNEYPGVTYEELAVEISMVKLSQTLVPLITGNIHIMSNPMLDTTDKIVESGIRLADLCRRLDPEFNVDRLCIKVVATWEGLQACRILKSHNIQTLATTLFTMEQAILAAEAGCAYIAPFVHELKAFFDDKYDDGGPNLELCREAQLYYQAHSYKTQVLAAGVLTVEEAKKIAGVDHATLAPDLLYTLSKTRVAKGEEMTTSLFRDKALQTVQPRGKRTYIDHKAEWEEAFDKSYAGKGKWKTQQAIDIFCGYQIQYLELMIKRSPRVAIVNGPQAVES